MRRFLVSLAATGMLTAALAVPVAAHGVNPVQLQKAHWECVNVEGLGVHCFPPGHHASTASIPVLYFATDDITEADTAFLGTELLLRADLYHGQPCPQEGEDAYHGLDFTGDGITDYYACHHS